jgi:3-keto-disaccharide hydrolase
MFIRSLTLFLAAPLLIPAAEPNQLSPAERTAGWVLLFDGKSPEGWHSYQKKTFPTKGWAVEDGWLHGAGQGGGDILSDGAYDQFELQWEWKLAPGGNSGLKYFVLETRKTALGHEYQMLDDVLNPDGKVAAGKHVTASFYDVLKPTISPPTRPMGEINQSRIIVRGDHVEHWLNGTKVLEYECGSPAVQAAVAESKFKNVAGFGNRAKGHILLQEHGSDVWFRNIKLRKLASD